LQFLGFKGVSLFFEKMGQKSGDIATKQLVNMAVQNLIDVATGPLATASLSLKAVNALTILDGLIAHTVFNALQRLYRK